MACHLNEFMVDFYKNNHKKFAYFRNSKFIWISFPLLTFDDGPIKTRFAWFGVAEHVSPGGILNGGWPAPARSEAAYLEKSVVFFVFAPAPVSGL